MELFTIPLSLVVPQQRIKEEFLVILPTNVQSPLVLIPSLMSQLMLMGFNFVNKLKSDYYFMTTVLPQERILMSWKVLPPI
jgi:hypothetical protein